MSDVNIATVGVAGAGAMGQGIAQSCLQAGLSVIMYDLSSDALQQAKGSILMHMGRLVEKGKLAPELLESAQENLRLSQDIAGLAGADAVIEAIAEKREPKRALFAALEGVVRDDAILATNTSSLSVAAIAAGCVRRERVCGMHFFNPVPLMRLVEIIAAPQTSAATVDAAAALAARLGKSTVRVKDVPGFLVNLLGRAYVTEALHIALEGAASIETIDMIMREAAGFRMGPFELMDLTGIDVNFPATSAIYEGFQHDPRLKTTILHEALFNAGTYGRKTGSGYHSYGEDAGSSGREAERLPPDGLSVCIADDDPGLAGLADRGLRRADIGDADVILVAPQCEDATTTAVRMGLDPARTVAVDLLGLERGFVTVMAPPGGSTAAQRFAACLRGMNLAAVAIGDSPGFVAPRIAAMIANLGCEVAQMGIGSPQDIDLAMKLAQNYPLGSLEWAERLGLRRAHAMLQSLQETTGSDRYRPSLWLRRRAQLGLPVHTPA